MTYNDYDLNPVILIYLKKIIKYLKSVHLEARMDYLSTFADFCPSICMHNCMFSNFLS